MSVLPDRQSLLTATHPVVCTLLDEAAAKGYQRGVLAVHASPRWEGGDSFTHAGRPVRVVPCPSTLAVWEALRERGGDGWLVILTPRDADDLGVGALTHFVWNRLRTPDPWAAVQHRFAATSLDPDLYRHAKPREVATGLLAAMPENGWPPAPGGVLTRDHALDAVVRAQLTIVDRDIEVDLTAVLEWSLRPSSAAALADLRALVGDPLTDAVIAWLAGRCGGAAAPIHALLRAGRVADLVPLGLVAGVLDVDDPNVARAVGQFEGTYGLGRVPPEVLGAWHGEAFGLTTQVLPPEVAHKVVAVASTRLRELGIDELAETSDLLPAGLQFRQSVLARELRRLVPDADPTASERAVDHALVDGDFDAVERAWARVREHHLAATETTVQAGAAALRLVRWLATDTTLPSGELAGLVDRHVAADGWVDTAVNDAAGGTTHPELADVLGDVLELVRLRRDAHDLAFGDALAVHDEPEELTVERLLPDYVIPLARAHPVLLVVVDALSIAAATELIADAARRGWIEHTLPNHERRIGALAVLPTLTEFSRCSLLSGELRHGYADEERRGFAELVRRVRLGAAVCVDVPLFHQNELDSSPPGLALPPRAQTAIADTQNRRLVAMVLNTVDDTLHHTDPGGTRWTLSTVRHLLPLLDAARRADRTVVITSDHGHVIERRDGKLRRHDAVYGLRARADDGTLAASEVLVRGPRVLTAEGTAVLAVNERIRYGPLAAGYHGGGSPAEVVVPVMVLHSGDAPSETGLTPLGDVEPPWWRPAQHGIVVTPAPASLSPALEVDGLFDLSSSTESIVDGRPTNLARAVVRSRMFARQRAVAGRVPVPDEKIVGLLAALLSGPGRRIPGRHAAAELGIAPTRLRGAMTLLKRLLDVEGYSVLDYEQESGDVILHEPVLLEQFGLGG